MRSDRLFARIDFHSLVEHYKGKLVEAYEQLSDDEAIDTEIQVNLKKQFLLDIPVLRSQGEIWAEESVAKIDVTRLPNRMPSFDGRPIYEDVPQFTVHVPFDGDPDVFDIAPSIYSQSPAVGSIVGHEILLTFLMSMPGLDLQGSIDRTILQINSTLAHLREQILVLQQGLDVALAQSVMVRKQRIQMRSSAVHNLRMPVRPAQPKRSLTAAPAAKPAAPKAEAPAKPQTWDIFISHASEDKAYIDELHRTFVAAGVQVWLDKGTLRWGDRLRSRIDDGLKRSRYVMVVLSKAFLAIKKWTEYELDSAFALETVNEERILPLWYGITENELKAYSPGLSNRLALDSSKQSPTDLSNELLILLKRRSENAFPIAETVPVVEPASHAAEEIRKGEAVAYAWYWAKDGTLAGLFVRKAPSDAELFSLEEPDGTIHQSNRDDIAAKYISTDLRLRRDGLRRSTVMGSSEYPEFNLP